jgi:hypothetical protein
MTIFTQRGGAEVEEAHLDARRTQLAATPSRVAGIVASNE